MYCGVAGQHILFLLFYSPLPFLSFSLSPSSLSLDLPPPLVPTGGSQGSSPILPRHQQPSPNQSYNPFS